jgi:hypothetical protein
MNLGLEDEAFGVYQDVALTPLDLLASVVTPIFCTYCGSFYRLGIDYASAGLRVPLQANPKEAFADRAVDPLPSTVDTPLSEVVVDGRPSLGKPCGSRRHWQPLLKT